MAYIELREIHKRYNPGTPAEVHALRGVNLAISRGDMAAIMGPSGSGKSTLLHIIGCIDKADQGDYLLEGQSVDLMPQAELAAVRNRKVGFVLQEFGLILDETALENVSIPLIFGSARLGEIKPRVMKTLEMVGIADLVFKKARELSGGQKQRVAIARALVNDPDLILADEPTGALDRKTAKEILNILKSLNKQGRTVIIVTHNPKVAGVCEKTYILRDGIIIGE